MMFRSIAILATTTVLCCLELQQSNHFASATGTQMVMNWQKTNKFIPAVYVEPESIEEVQDIVRDNVTYPSPVRPAGFILSPSNIHNNTDGTMVVMTNMNIIHGVVEIDGVSLIETDPGATLRELQIYAQENDLELPFSAEIGFPTIGGTVFAVTKDSCLLDAPVEGMGIGDVGSMLYKMQIVEDDGEVHEYTVKNEDGEFDPYFQGLLDSYGTRGILVRLWITTRPQTPLTTTYHVRVRDPNNHRQLAQELYDLRRSADERGGNIFTMLGVIPPLAITEERIPTEKDNLIAPLSFFLAPMMTIMKKYWYERCIVPVWTRFIVPMSGTFLLRYYQKTRSPGYHYTWDVPEDRATLTFSYYAFDEEEFVDTITKGLDFVRDYEAEHGFAPYVFSVFHVTHSKKRLAGPYAGTERTYSYSFDPNYDDPKDPKWIAFIKAWNGFCKENNGRPSLNQSLELEEDPEYGGWAVWGEPSQRFLSDWLKPFFDNRETNTTDAPTASPEL